MEENEKETEEKDGKKEEKSDVEIDRFFFFSFYSTKSNLDDRS